MTYSFLLALAVVYIFPFVIAIVTSFKTEPDATANPLALVPHPATTAAFHDLYQDQDFLLWVKNSVIVTLSVTFLRVFLDSLAGYALARLRFRGRGCGLRDDRRRDGGAGRRAPDPEVPDHPAARDLRHLLRDDHPAARRRRRRLHHEELLRVDPRQRRGVGADRRREPLPHLLVDRAADGASGARSRSSSCRSRDRGTSSRTSSSRRRARASTR